MAQSAYPQLVNTETKLNQGDNEWGDVERNLTILSSGGKKATKLVKKRK